MHFVVIPNPTPSRHQLGNHDNIISHTAAISIKVKALRASYYA